MSPELKLYYQHVDMDHIAKGAGTSNALMVSKLQYERKKLGLIKRPRTPDKWMSDDVLEFVSDKSLVLELYKSGLTIAQIADKWGINGATAGKYMSKWGAVIDKITETITLAGLYTGWADIPQGQEMLLTINRRPMFKLVRII